MHALDQLDLQLLKRLAKNGRISHVELASQVFLSSSAVARRQRSLEDAGIITGYSANVSPKALGLNATVLVHVALTKQSDEALSDFERAVTSCENVVQCFLMSGEYDYMLVLLVRDLEDFERVHKMHLSRFPAVLRIQSSFAIREVLKRPIPDISL
ncbi:Lrp/AsnC family transcriptional regulator [Caenimonas soli]|uniref:Lrp/AsnC family transcriptional regulator n=1 Tax=Caenimonas soli TaxID=2735555 RepID=UPI001553A80D|nr:Lrp/AsnC family transcriptional regulator [Caenimonas soli]NPC57775.1 Lrp/AsnC family transcriptional regulator [Caenimonas soli]